MIAFLGQVLIGAIIGAIVGGFTAAIAGGDITKGMLYGAAAGAVMGGVKWAIGAYSSSLKPATDVAANSTETATEAAQAPGEQLTYRGLPSVPQKDAVVPAPTPDSGFSWKSFLESKSGGMIGEAAIMMGGQMIAGGFGTAAAEKQAKAQREYEAEQNRLTREHQMAMLKEKEAGGGADNTVGLANIAEQRRQFDLSHQQATREYEELRQERLDSIASARGALESAVVARKNTARPDSPSILQQVKEDREINPDTMPVADEEGNITYV